MRENRKIRGLAEFVGENAPSLVGFGAQVRGLRVKEGREGILKFEF